jgi:predicted nucleic acid-binding protein
MTTFIDTNVLVYLMEETSPFHEWAKQVVDERRNDGPIIACDIVYSEFSVAMNTKEDTDLAMDALAIERLPFTNDVLYHAGKAFKKYKSNGGAKNNVLADFLIGAQAAIEDAPLLTNNVKDYRSYFPDVTIIRPPATVAA